MSIVVTTQGAIELLDKALSHTTDTENYTLKLYKTKIIPTTASTSSSFVEADFTNYTGKTLTRSSWSASQNINDNAEASYSVVQTWTCGTTGNTIYGYWVEASNSGSVLWAEILTTPVTLKNGDTINITPKITLK